MNWKMLYLEETFEVIKFIVYNIGIVYQIKLGTPFLHNDSNTCNLEDQIKCDPEDPTSCLKLWLINYMTLDASSG